MPEPATEFRLMDPDVMEYGIHFCVGSELARMEARIAFETLTREFSDWDVVREDSDLTHPPTFAQHGYKKIVLAFTKA